MPSPYTIRRTFKSSTRASTDPYHQQRQHLDPSTTTPSPPRHQDSTPPPPQAHTGGSWSWRFRDACNTSSPSALMGIRTAPVTPTPPPRTAGGQRPRTPNDVTPYLSRAIHQLLTTTSALHEQHQKKMSHAEAFTRFFLQNTMMVALHELYERKTMEEEYWLSTIVQRADEVVAVKTRGDRNGTTTMEAYHTLVVLFEHLVAQWCMLEANHKTSTEHHFQRSTLAAEEHDARVWGVHREEVIAWKVLLLCIKESRDRDVLRRRALVPYHYSWAIQTHLVLREGLCRHWNRVQEAIERDSIMGASRNTPLYIVESNDRQVREMVEATMETKRKCAVEEATCRVYLTHGVFLVEMEKSRLEREYLEDAHKPFLAEIRLLCANYKARDSLLTSAIHGKQTEYENEGIKFFEQLKRIQAQHAQSKRKKVVDNEAEDLNKQINALHHDCMQQRDVLQHSQFEVLHAVYVACNAEKDILEQSRMWITHIIAEKDLLWRKHVAKMEVLKREVIQVVERIRNADEVDRVMRASETERRELWTQYQTMREKIWFDVEQEKQAILKLWSEETPPQEGVHDDMDELQQMFQMMEVAVFMQEARETLWVDVGAEKQAMYLDCAADAQSLFADFKVDKTRIAE
eukprot:PhF_6_TR11562/c1_g1_i1/m.18632